MVEITTNSRRTVSFCALNVCGLRSQLNVPELDFFGKFDIVSLTETDFDDLDVIISISLAIL